MKTNEDKMQEFFDKVVAVMVVVMTLIIALIAVTLWLLSFPAPF